MPRITNWEEYENESFFKKIPKKKPTSKGHVTKHDIRENEWDKLLDENSIDQVPVLTMDQPSLIEKTKSKNYPSKPSIDVKPKEKATEEHKSHEFGVNTHEIKTVKIDFDGVANMEKIESVYEGKQTYGIKFTFKGKGFTRTIWYNQRMKERDMVFDQEKTFWDSLNHK